MIYPIGWLRVTKFTSIGNYTNSLHIIICWTPIVCYIVLQPSIVHAAQRLKKAKLQVETFGLALALGLEHTLSGLSEIGHVHPHSTFSQRHETSFTAHGTDVSTREVILLVDELFEVNILSQRHLGCVEGKDLALGVFCV